MWIPDYRFVVCVFSGPAGARPNYAHPPHERVSHSTTLLLYMGSGKRVSRALSPAQPFVGGFRVSEASGSGHRGVSYCTVNPEPLSLYCRYGTEYSVGKGLASRVAPRTWPVETWAADSHCPRGPDRRCAPALLNMKRLSWCHHYAVALLCHVEGRGRLHGRGCVQGKYWRHGGRSCRSLPPSVSVGDENRCTKCQRHGTCDADNECSTQARGLHRWHRWWWFGVLVMGVLDKVVRGRERLHPEGIGNHGSGREALVGCKGIGPAGALNSDGELHGSGCNRHTHLRGSESQCDGKIISSLRGYCPPPCIVVVFDRTRHDNVRNRRKGAQVLRCWRGRRNNELSNCWHCEHV